MIEVLTTAIVSNVLVMGVLCFLSKSLINHLLKKDQKNHQNQLEIEKLRFQASFGWVYEKQAKAMSELYAFTLELESKVNDGILSAEKWNEYNTQLVSLRNYYHENRIYIPETLDKKILKIVRVGIEIQGKSSQDPFCKDLAEQLRSSKEEALYEMRKLFAIVGKDS